MATLSYSVTFTNHGMSRTATFSDEVGKDVDPVKWYEKARVLCEQGVIGQEERMTAFDLSVMGNTEVIMCTQLTVETKDGKPYYKVRGGRFAEFGVRVWEEVLQAANITITGFAPLDLTGWRATILFKDDGKPLKVVNLVKVQ